jgi:surface polysaccharide O-acyltransferase-like enzyme
MKIYKENKELNLLITFCYWHVDSFALVSGIVGFKGNKYSNLIYLWLCTVFYSVTIHRILSYFINIPIKIYKFSNLFFPVIMRSYWYFSDYFCLNLFIPIINKGLIYIEKYELMTIIANLISCYIIFKDTINPKFDTLHLESGFSVLWLLILYIIGVFIGKYLINVKKTKNIFFYLGNLAIFLSSTFLTNYLHEHKGQKLKIIENLFKRRYNSLGILLQVISLSLFVLFIKYNKLITKIITFLGPLTFGVYLIHDNTLVRNYIVKKFFVKYSSNLKSIVIISLVLLKGLLVFIICLIIEYFRHILFTILKIRQLCEYFQKKILN